MELFSFFLFAARKAQRRSFRAVPPRDRGFPFFPVPPISPFMARRISFLFFFFFLSEREKRRTSFPFPLFLPILVSPPSREIQLRVFLSPFFLKVEDHDIEITLPLFPTFLVRERKRFFFSILLANPPVKGGPRLSPLFFSFLSPPLAARTHKNKLPLIFSRDFLRSFLFLFLRRRFWKL